MRFGRALRCFFAILFRGQLPPIELEALAAKLPPREVGPALEKAAPPPKALPPAGDAAVQILAILQRDGRLVDFLLEPIDAYSDPQIGAAIRDIHAGCKKALDQYLIIAPVMTEAEESRVGVPVGFDPSAIRLVGNVAGAPPFHGTLRHRGWKTTRVMLPATPVGQDPHIIAPAEVEVA